MVHTAFTATMFNLDNEMERRYIVVVYIVVLVNSLFQHIVEKCYNALSKKRSATILFVVVLICTSLLNAS